MKSTAGEMRTAARTPRRCASCETRRSRRDPAAAATDAIPDSRLANRRFARSCCEPSRMLQATRVSVRFQSVAEIQLERLTKVYPDGTQAVSELDLDVADGELVVFVGPSGCGKTSALRMIAGLEDITSGHVRIGGEVVDDLPPKSRAVAMVFQNYA